MLSKTLEKPNEHEIEQVPCIEVPKTSLAASKSAEGIAMIKKISNLSTVSEPNSANEELKHQELETEQYIDSYDQESLSKAKSESSSSSKKQQMRWLGKALDWFRSVENHKKSGIFYKPYIPSDIDTLEKNLEIDMSVTYPITLKTVGVKLSLNLYESYGEFKRDMLWVFKNSNFTPPKNLFSM